MKVYLTLTADEIHQIDTALSEAVIHAPNPESKLKVAKLKLKIQPIFPLAQDVALVSFIPTEERNEVQELPEYLPNGCDLFIRKNEAGGRTYFSNEIGGGVFVWDTCLVSSGTLLAAMNHENMLQYREAMEERGKKPKTTETPYEPKAQADIQQAETEGVPPLD